jgi:tetratricopeptide (TPR) repeat protein
MKSQILILLITLFSLSSKAQEVERWLAAGQAAFDTANYNAAEQCFSKAVEAGPKIAKAYYLRGKSRAKLDKFEEAIEDYDKFLEWDIKNADVYDAKGNAYSSLEKPRKALEYYTKAIELNPRKVNFYLHRGNTDLEI